MDATSFFTSSRVLLIAGKGGVGKTTVTAIAATAAARLGLSVLIVEIEGRSGLPTLFDHAALEYREAILADAGALGPRSGPVRARTITADEALVEYLGDHGMSRLARKMIDTGVVEVITRSAPGMKDILVLGKIKQIERAGGADVVLVDTPASGHAMSFLRSPRGLLDAVRHGPINHQANEVLDLLTDPARAQVMLVTLAEETPVNETIEAAFALEDTIGVRLGPVVVNGLVGPLAFTGGNPPAAKDAATAARARPAAALRDALDAAATFRQGRVAVQAHQVERLVESLPLPLVRLRHRFVAGLTSVDIVDAAEEFVDALAGLGDRWSARP